MKLNWCLVFLKNKIRIDFLRVFKPIVIVCFSLWVAGCAFFDLRPDRVAPKEFKDAFELKKQPEAKNSEAKRFRPPPPAVADALLPDLGLAVQQKNAVQRFDISVMQVDAREFFMGLVADGDQNVIVHPDVKGSITINLKNVTLPEVLDAVREIYGFDYKKVAAGYIIYPAELMSRIYHIDYLNVIRNGRSETRVSAAQQGAGQQAGQQSAQQPAQQNQGAAVEERIDCSMLQRASSQSASSQPAAPSGGLAGMLGMAPPGADAASASAGLGAAGAAAPGGASSSSGLPSAFVSSMPGTAIATVSNSNFWKELKQALSMIVCVNNHQSDNKPQMTANFVVNQQNGVIVVRAFSKQLREVEQFLEAIRKESQRQVVLEAKILEVVLNDGYQAGVNWASLIRAGNIGGGTALSSLAGPIGTASAAASVFTLNASKGDFSIFIEMLETQGEVHTLSSPRISTLNNQKAVIKVGTDSIHISNITSGTATTSTAGLTTQAISTPSFSTFFSGIALDVTPQIDDVGRVTLHVHPSVTDVVDRDLNFNLDGKSQTLPLAVNTVRESDSLIHAENGQIVVIGGLMQNQENNDRQGVAWFSRIPWVGSLFRRGQGTFRKSELVILLKPMVAENEADWSRARQNVSDRFKELEDESRHDPLP